MATILNDKELKKLFGTVITDADKSCIRPNSYILRLGSNGAFINTGKGFELKENKGIRLNPGHAVGITALETIDFSHDTVNKIFPGCDLHGFLSPTTDLSREGLIAPSTQIDAGYKGTLNWTITNPSGKKAEFVYGEKLFRMTIVRLEKGERPELPYQGDYQEKQGYVPSRRRGAPKGMKESDWVNTGVDGGPEEQLEELINSGHPWDILGTRLKYVDNYLNTLANGYADIRQSIVKLDDKISRIDDTTKDRFRNMENRLMLTFILVLLTLISVLIGVVFSIISNPNAWDWIMNHSSILAGIFLVVAGTALIFSFKRKK